MLLPIMVPPQLDSKPEMEGATQRLASAAWRVNRGRTARRLAGEPRPTRIGAPISHVSCMRLFGGGRDHYGTLKYSPIVLAINSRSSTTTSSHKYDAK